MSGFTTWFLTAMRDHMRLCATLFEPDGLADRYAGLVAGLYPENDRLPRLVRHVLAHGEMALDDENHVPGAPDRNTRDDLAVLLENGFITREAPKGAVRIAFPVSRREALFPGLFADGNVVD